MPLRIKPASKVRWVSSTDETKGETGFARESRGADGAPAPDVDEVGAPLNFVSRDQPVVGNGGGIVKTDNMRAK